MTADANFKIWDGVWALFAEAPAFGPGFNGPIWLNRSIEAARDAERLLETSEPLDYALRQRYALLPTITALLLGEKPRVRILDFGGGLGIGFIVLAKTVQEARNRLDYVVVEGKTICQAGRELFAGKLGPTFTSELRDDEPYDIVHTASTIQYIEDWKGLIASLADYRARYLVLADAFVGNVGSYVTLQKYYDSRLRHWMVNRDEMVGEVQRHGYTLALQSVCDARSLGRYGPLPMQNFPPEMRIDHSAHLLFRRNAS